MRFSAFARPRRLALLTAGLALGIGMIALALGAVQTQRIAAAAEAATPPAGQFLDLDGRRIHYVDRGQGPAVLFLHGLSGTLLQLSDPLFDRLDGFRLIAVDRPGSGYSERGPDFRPGIRDQAEGVSRLVEKLGLGRVLVVGHSFGGAIALQLALDHPEQVAGLALIAPLAHPTDRLLGEFKYLVIRPAALRALVAYTVGAPYAARGFARGLDQTFGPQAPPAHYETTGGGRLVLRPGAILTASDEAVALIDRPDLREMQARYPELAMPIDVLFGAKDRILNVDTELDRMKEAVPQLRIEVLQGVGHMVQFSEPEKTAAFIRATAERAFAPASAASPQ